jgi:hypothetical protein
MDWSNPDFDKLTRFLGALGWAAIGLALLAAVIFGRSLIWNKEGIAIQGRSGFSNISFSSQQTIGVPHTADPKNPGSFSAWQSQCDHDSSIALSGTCVIEGEPKTDPLPFLYNLGIDQKSGSKQAWFCQWSGSVRRATVKVLCADN